jgi:hypothetical protein
MHWFELELNNWHNKTRYICHAIYIKHCLLLLHGCFKWCLIGLQVNCYHPPAGAVAFAIDGMRILVDVDMVVRLGVCVLLQQKHIQLRGPDCRWHSATTRWIPADNSFPPSTQTAATTIYRKVSLLCMTTHNQNPEIVICKIEQTLWMNADCATSVLRWSLVVSIHCTACLRVCFDVESGVWR